jgi:hypothetical protein
VFFIVFAQLIPAWLGLVSNHPRTQTLLHLYCLEALLRRILHSPAWKNLNPQYHWPAENAAIVAAVRYFQMYPRQLTSYPNQELLYLLLDIYRNHQHLTPKYLYLCAVAADQGDRVHVY